MMISGGFSVKTAKLLCWLNGGLWLHWLSWLILAVVEPFQ